MVVPFDIFSVRSNEPKWLGSAETLLKALVLAVHEGEGLYFVFSQATGHKQFYKVGADGTLERVASAE
jgi:hypothetical protein